MSVCCYMLLYFYFYYFCVLLKRGHFFHARLIIWSEKSEHALLALSVPSSLREASLGISLKAQRSICKMLVAFLWRNPTVTASALSLYSGSIVCTWFA